jgi:hypothetical protein
MQRADANSMLMLSCALINGCLPHALRWSLIKALALVAPSLGPIAYLVGVSLACAATDNEPLARAHSRQRVARLTAFGQDVLY